MATATAQEREALTWHIEGLFGSQYGGATEEVLRANVEAGSKTSFAVYYEEDAIGRIGCYETDLFGVRACSVREYAELVVDRIMADVDSLPLPEEIYCVDVIS